MRHDDELDELVRELERTQARPLRLRVKQPEADLRGIAMFVAGAIGLTVALACGVYFGQQNLIPSPQPEDALAPRGDGVARPGGALSAQAQLNGGESSRNATFQSAMKSALENRLRPPGCLDPAVGRQYRKLQKVDDLHVPLNGKPLIVCAVLAARLDEVTERHWRDAGLLKNESVVTNPFLRTVTLSNPEGLDYLLDWHVEGVWATSPLRKE